MLQILVNILHETLLGFNETTEDIHIEIKELDWCIGNDEFILLQIIQIRKHLSYLRQRFTWQYAIIDWFTDWTSKFSKTKTTDLLLIGSFIQSSLLQVVLSKALQMSMMSAVVDDWCWTCYVIQICVVDALIKIISFLVTYWCSVAYGSDQRW